MGNRAVITTMIDSDVSKSDQLGIYLHWNGGRDSVEAFLKYADMCQVRYPENDSYGWARLIQIIANFLGGNTGISIDKCSQLDCDNYDNGVYLIEKWQIVGRQYFKDSEQSEYDFIEMLEAIDNAQPIKMGKDKILELIK